MRKSKAALQGLQGAILQQLDPAVVEADGLQYRRLRDGFRTPHAEADSFGGDTCVYRELRAVRLPCERLTGETCQQGVAGFFFILQRKDSAFP